MATITIENLGFPWATRDPFLFCVHHLDFYPKGNGKGGPAASLRGRQIGNDFIIKDGWRMYHGDKIPGFPAHPHRGFETVTVVQKGMVDHADSMGAAGRYGGGDVQWMTAGSGVQHSEMFPLLEENQGNTLELFQIWLNLPKHRKMVDPNFKMLWAETIPTSTFTDEAGRSIQVIQYFKGIGTKKGPVPTPDSWASDATNDVAIWVISLDEQATEILLSKDYLSFNKEGYEFPSSKSSEYIEGEVRLNSLPDFSVFKIQHSNPQSAQYLSNHLPELLNQYSVNSEQEFYIKERLKLQKQLGDIRDSQEKILLEINNLTQKGVTTVNLVEGGSDINIMTQLKLRLGEKLADKALAFASNEQEKYQKIKQKLTDLKNRRVEILSSATLPESPIKPKTRLIVALSAVVSLFVGIFLVFVIEFIKNAKFRLQEKEEGLSPA